MTIHLKDVTKRFKKNRGIEHISFTLEEGQIVALVGANGAGKSTIIKLLTNQLTSDSGVVEGVVDESLRYMPDDLTFPDTLTANEILALLGQLKGVKKDSRFTILKKVGLQEAGHLKVSQYSKGMRQRLNLAQSLLGEGQFYILDEPTNGLDPFWIATLKQILIEEKKKKHIVLFSTHLLTLAEEIADHVIIIHEGKVLEQGAIGELLAKYQCNKLEQLWLQLTQKEHYQ
ncbi:MAG: ABC transporter ATP-binding protein [Solibacillus sp.]|uniref:ABC transporter ATP-binding protein n=1 Tax=Solibacillus sp. TaxID=1909654 RepID=UPI0033155318